jgi:transcriptional regulator with XRE-family HTH domain
MEAEDIRRRLGLRVQALRRQRGMTQEQLAEAVGRSVDTISNIETGRLSTRIDTAGKLAGSLGTTLAELFEFEERARSTIDRNRRAAIDRLVQLLEPIDTQTISAMTEITERILALRSSDGASRSHRSSKRPR